MFEIVYYLKLFLVRKTFFPRMNLQEPVEVDETKDGDKKVDAQKDKLDKRTSRSKSYAAKQNTFDRKRGAPQAKPGFNKFAKNKKFKK